MNNKDIFKQMQDDKYRENICDYGLKLIEEQWSLEQFALMMDEVEEGMYKNDKKKKENEVALLSKPSSQGL